MCAAIMILILYYLGLCAMYDMISWIVILLCAAIHGKTFLSAVMIFIFADLFQVIPSLREGIILGNFAEVIKFGFVMR